MFNLKFSLIMMIFKEKARVDKAKEDAYWVDDDKHALKKQQKKVCLFIRMI